MQSFPWHCPADQKPKRLWVRDFQIVFLVLITKHALTIVKGSIYFTKVMCHENKFLLCATYQKLKGGVSSPTPCATTMEVWFCVYIQGLR